MDIKNDALEQVSPFESGYVRQIYFQSWQCITYLLFFFWRSFLPYHMSHPAIFVELPAPLTSFNKNMHQPNSKKRFLYTHYKDSPRGKGLLDDHPQQGREGPSRPTLRPCTLV